MSKKRQSRKSPRAQAAQAAPSANGERAETRSRNRRGAQAFNPDYSQTIKDLKRIGILASSFFVVLVVLSFFLR